MSDRVLVDTIPDLSRTTLVTNGKHIICSISESVQPVRWVGYHYLTDMYVFTRH